MERLCEWCIHFGLCIQTQELLSQVNAVREESKDNQKGIFTAVYCSHFKFNRKAIDTYPYTTLPHYVELLTR